MKVLFLNNEGAGYADYVDVEPGTTVQQFFAKHFPGGEPHGFLIRVNRQPVAAEQALEEGDRISMTPTMIAGADAARPSATRPSAARPMRRLSRPA